jgi:hypothetical protein
MMLGIMVVMTGMEMAFVDDDKPLGRESARQLLLDPILSGHPSGSLPYGLCFPGYGCPPREFPSRTSLPQNAQNRA